MRARFKAENIPMFISCTPNLGTNRTDEIICWLQDNTDFNEDGLHEVLLETKVSKQPNGTFFLAFHSIVTFW